MSSWVYCDICHVYSNDYSIYDYSKMYNASKKTTLRPFFYCVWKKYLFLSRSWCFSVKFTNGDKIDIYNSHWVRRIVWRSQMGNQ
jgi:hypothetical protein